MIKLPKPIYQLKSPNFQNYLISVTWFEWAIKLPNPIYQLKSPNCHNYLTSVTWFEWAIQLPHLIYQLNWVTQLPTQFPSCTLKVCKLPDICYPVWLGNIIPSNIDSTIFVTHFSGQHNYPTQLTNIAQCLWSIWDGWYNYPSWFTKIGAEISKHPNPILVPNHCDLL